MFMAVSRRMALAVSGAAVALTTNPVEAAVRTPRQTAGPFYPEPEDRPADTDWDLVRVEGQVRAAGGDVMWLVGQVLDTSGVPVPGVRLEIWQCDVNGRYHHPRDAGEGRPKDTGFQGLGAVETDGVGSYRFRTIRPVAYPGRTPHIHARLIMPDGRELVTQIYLLDEPGNRGDFIFRSLGRRGQAAVSVDPVRREDGDLEAFFNFVI
ncbi:MAG: protocatechuate 3,4-dioxygenase [Pseudomonadota bacterium]